MCRVSRHTLQVFCGCDVENLIILKLDLLSNRSALILIKILTIYVQKSLEGKNVQGRRYAREKSTSANKEITLGDEIFSGRRTSVFALDEISRRIKLSRDARRDASRRVVTPRAERDESSLAKVRCCHPLRSRYSIRGIRIVLRDARGCL